MLQAWLTRLDIAGKGLDEGIRAMVLKMRLPGEAQQIDRLIEKFAEEYYRQNPGRFSHVDTSHLAVRADVSHEKRSCISIPYYIG